ncbi:MAG: EAL domain-containing protein [Clostridia bacterium]|nr:EAL domain-containing protein [Clostridia bacterium]
MGKRNLRFEKIDKDGLIKALSIIIVVLVVQVIVAFAVCKVTENTAYTAAKEEYTRISANIAESLSQTCSSMDGDTADYTATLNGTTITLSGDGEDAKTYMYTSGLSDVTAERYLITPLSGICNTLSDNVYIVTASGQSNVYYFKSLQTAVSAAVGAYDGIMVASSTGNIIWSQGIFSGYLSDYASAFSTPYSGVETTEEGGVTYALACTPVGESGYWLVTYTDYSVQQANISSMGGKVAAAIAASSIAVLAALAVCTLMFAASEKGTLHVYRFEVDSYGRVTSTDKAFERDFPSVIVVPADVDAYDQSKYNAIQLTSKDGDKILACTVRRRRNGRSVLYAGEVSLAQYGADKRNVMEDVFNAFYGGGKRTLAGQIYFANLQMLTVMFGKHFGEEVRRVLVSKCREKFTYVYAVDNDHVGILFPDGKELDYLVKDLPAIFDYLNQPVRVENNLVNIEVKAGFALCDGAMATKTYDYAMVAVDAALKRACEGKENAYYYVYHESQKKLYAKHFLDFDIEQMLKEGAFEMEYQPQYSLSENRIVGFESLFRLKKSRAINVSTFDIITYAERSGYMIVLGEFIFDTSMAFAKEVEDLNVTVSLNVSPIQFMQAGFVENFLKLYRKHNIKPGVVCIEITESFLMTNFDMVIKKMEILREQGIEFHLDDFGTRYSSLLYLKNLPISCIKIDMEFIRDLLENEYSRAITSMIISVTNSLGLFNIAEGVETKEQLDALREMNCAVIQGWYIGKSMSPEAALELLGVKREDKMIPDAQGEAASADQTDTKADGDDKGDNTPQEGEKGE